MSVHRMKLTDAVLPSIIADIHGPIDVGCASAYVERHPELALPRMVIVRERDLHLRPAPVVAPVASADCMHAYCVNPPFLQTAHDPPMTDAAIETFLEFLDEVFTQSDEPFSVLWNVRGGAFPTIAQFKTVIAWLDKDDRSTSWDRRVQGNAAIIRSPLLRAGARLMVSIAKPPQPSLVCNDEEKALQWARDTCSEAREWA